MPEMDYVVVSDHAVIMKIDGNPTLCFESELLMKKIPEVLKSRD